MDSEKEQMVVKKFFGNDVCMYIEIDKITRSTNKKLEEAKVCFSVE